MTLTLTLTHIGVSLMQNQRDNEELRENGETASDADSAFGDDFKYRLSHVRSD